MLTMAHYRRASVCLLQEISRSIRWNSTAATATSKLTHLKIEKRGSNEKARVALVTLTSPTSKTNTLSYKMVEDLGAAFDQIHSDKSVGAIVVTGNNTVFCGGADIPELSKIELSEALSAHRVDFLVELLRIVTCRLPVIAAVNGFCLGGGLELALAFDIILAGEKARFGFSEVRIGAIPGFGGTQRLIRQVGKSRAMEMILTGEIYTAQDMARYGLVSRVLPMKDVVGEALRIGEKIASMSQLATSFAKQSVTKAEDLPLAEGIQYERRLFYTLFASHDKNEGMKAFLEKRAPQWKHC